MTINQLRKVAEKHKIPLFAHIRSKAQLYKHISTWFNRLKQYSIIGERQSEIDRFEALQKEVNKDL